MVSNKRKERIPEGIDARQIQVCNKILREAGFETKLEPKYGKVSLDIEAMDENHGKHLFVEIKSGGQRENTDLLRYENSIRNTCNIAKTNNGIPVLLILAIADDIVQESVIKKFPDLKILDIRNLLYLVENTNLEDDLIGILPYSVEGIEKKDNSIIERWFSHSNKSDDLIIELDSIVSGRANFGKFEDICTDILKNVFSDDLTLWKQQQQSNDGLFRFDLVCRIKDDATKTFWNIIENYFNSKYVVFEFKNYSDKITQKEVYTTERYLYKASLRNIAIIICKNGFDENALWAAKGSLRENGKLIMLLTVDDLKELYRRKQNIKEPAVYLLNLLDDLLVTLEK